MEPTTEIRRLLDVMPASGRMMTKIVSKPEQAKVIDSPFPLPWNQERPLFINFDLWRLVISTYLVMDVSAIRCIPWISTDKLIWFMFQQNLCEICSLKLI